MQTYSKTDARLADDETVSLISADKVEGTAVYNNADEKIGTIEDVMINKRSGFVAYAVMSFGGFLGIGEKYHPLPWQVLKYDTSVDGYRINLDKETLKGAPSYDRAALSDLNWSDTAWNRQVHEYYKLPPTGLGL
jgi:hypothetical protein